MAMGTSPTLPLPFLSTEILHPLPPFAQTLRYLSGPRMNYCKTSVRLTLRSHPQSDQKKLILLLHTVNSHAYRVWLFYCRACSTIFFAYSRYLRFAQASMVPASHMLYPPVNFSANGPANSAHGPIILPTADLDWLNVLCQRAEHGLFVFCPRADQSLPMCLH